MPWVVRRMYVYWRGLPTADGKWWTPAPDDARVYDTEEEAAQPKTPMVCWEAVNAPVEVVDLSEALLSYGARGGRWP